MAYSATPYLSKSLYIKGLQCHKALWLQKNRPELKDEVSVSQQSAFDSGTSVGILAQQLFPDGVEVPYDGLTPTEQLEMTRKLMADGVQTIYEAAFSFQNTFCKADILHHGPDGWEIYEVKASTGYKEVYLDDIALQYHLLTGCGLHPVKAFLVHLNGEYVRKGAIDPQQLFTMLDLTDEVRELQATVAANLTTQREMLQGEMPVIDIGPHCSSPYSCSFSGYCWSHIPDNSIFSLRDHGKPDAWQLYQEGYLKIVDVPEERLGWRQKLQQRGMSEEFLQFDHDAVSRFVESLVWPLCFMDFETLYMVPVPLWDNVSPYQQIPFQFSLHIIDQAGAEPHHHEFLAEGTADPRRHFTEALLASVPATGSVLTWNATFEKQRIVELAVCFPDCAVALQQLSERVVDLMIPFRRKEIYHSAFNGSYSIKAVLPALCPELSYAELGIQNGEMASNSWLQMLYEPLAENRELIRSNLLEYCKLDTWAMVRIWEEIRKW